MSWKHSVEYSPVYCKRQCKERGSGNDYWKLDLSQTIHAAYTNCQNNYFADARSIICNLCYTRLNQNSHTRSLVGSFIRILLSRFVRFFCKFVLCVAQKAAQRSNPLQANNNNKIPIIIKTMKHDVVVRCCLFLCLCRCGFSSLHAVINDITQL